MTDRRNAFNLTSREQEVLEHVKQGDFPDEIADALNISTSTVRNHCTNIHSKLGLEPRAGILQGLARQEYRRIQRANAPLDPAAVDKARERF